MQTGKKRDWTSEVLSKFSRGQTVKMRVCFPVESVYILTKQWTPSNSGTSSQATSIHRCRNTLLIPSAFWHTVAFMLHLRFMLKRPAILSTPAVGKYPMYPGAQYGPVFSWTILPCHQDPLQTQQWGLCYTWCQRRWCLPLPWSPDRSGSAVKMIENVRLKHSFRAPSAEVRKLGCTNSLGHQRTCSFLAI